MDETLKAQAVEIIVGIISKINPNEMHSTKMWTERSVQASVLAKQFATQAGKKFGLADEAIDELKREIKAAALEAAK